MMRSNDDYGSMSSVYIRELVEKELEMKLNEFKKYIDVTIFQIYNQLVECASPILPYVLLGTEWNASNYEALITDNVSHILNVSNDVDNFFPDTFKYLNIRVRDVEDTDLLKEFDRTNKFIQEAKEQSTSCLVHCKMGVSRSASVVIAYLMKELNLSYDQAYSFAKQKRSCVKPNDGFKAQLRTYESILNAHRSKYNIFEPYSNNQLSPTSINSNDTNQTQQQTQTVNNCTLKTQQSNSKNYIDLGTDELQDGSEMINSHLSTSTMNKITGVSVKDTVNKLKSINSLDNTIATTTLPQASLITFSPNSCSKHQLFINSSNYQSNRKSDNLTAFTSLTENKNETYLSNSQTNLKEIDSDRFFNIKRTTSHLSGQKDFKNKMISSGFNGSSSRSVHATSEFNNYIGQRNKPSRLSYHESSPSFPTTSRKFFEDLKKSNNVKKIAEVYMSSNGVGVNSNNGVLGTVGSEDSFVPIGTVKRQVESINFKSRPCTPHCLTSNEEAPLIPNDSDNQLNEIETVFFLNEEPENLIPEQSQSQQQITTSPDSKRFKFEMFNFGKSSSACDRKSKVYEFIEKYNKSKELNTEDNQINKNTGDTKINNDNTNNSKTSSTVVFRRNSVLRPVSIDSNFLPSLRVNSTLSASCTSTASNKFSSNSGSSNKTLNSDIIIKTMGHPQPISVLVNKN